MFVESSLYPRGSGCNFKHFSLYRITIELMLKIWGRKNMKWHNIMYMFTAKSINSEFNVKMTKYTISNKAKPNRRKKQFQHQKHLF